MLNLSLISFLESLVLVAFRCNSFTFDSFNKSLRNLWKSLALFKYVDKMPYGHSLVGLVPKVDNPNLHNEPMLTLLEPSNPPLKLEIFNKPVLKSQTSFLQVFSFVIEITIFA
jgi:hypothetical protein